MMSRSIKNLYIASAWTITGTMIGVSIKIRTISDVRDAMRQQPMAHSVPRMTASVVAQAATMTLSRAAESQISFSNSAR